MHTPIKGSIKRQIRLYDVKAPIVLTITESGVEMAVVGQRKRISASWDHIARNASTPLDVPSYLAQRPIELLQHQAGKVNKEGR